jgi:hypothetical protein
VSYQNGGEDVPAIDGPVPHGKITAFDKDQYDKLIKFVDGVDQELNQNIRKPSAGVRLDATLGSGIFPGSGNWGPAKALYDKGIAFGTSVADLYKQLDQDWEAYVTALKDARDVFEDTGNLATYGATEFADENPGLIGGSAGGGGTTAQSEPP